MVSSILSCFGSVKYEVLLLFNTKVHANNFSTSNLLFSTRCVCDDYHVLLSKCPGTYNQHDGDIG